MEDARFSQEEKRRVLMALAKEEEDGLEVGEIEALIQRELKKHDEQMDVELIDACCALLCAMHGREDICARQEKVPSYIAAVSGNGHVSSLSRRIIRFVMRTAAVAACMMIAYLGADVVVNRRTMRITQSADQQQALVAYEAGSGTVVQHADANSDSPFERIYLAPSLEALWKEAGYTLPLPQTLPEGMRATRAYLLPMGSVDMITVVYEDEKDGRVCVEYWYDASRESVLLGYESWDSCEEVMLQSGNTVLRFPEKDTAYGAYHAVFIAPHMTCAITGENIDAQAFDALLESMGPMEKSAPPQDADAAYNPLSPLARQEKVTEFAPPQLHFYSLEQMEACVRYEVPLPAFLPEGLSFGRGIYVHQDDWDSIDIRFYAQGDKQFIFDYDLYGTGMDGLSMGVEQNEKGRCETLQNGLEAYIAYNCEDVFGLIVGKQAVLSVHLIGYDEQTLLKVLNSLPELPADF